MTTMRSLLTVVVLLVSCSLAGCANNNDATPGTTEATPYSTSSAVAVVDRDMCALRVELALSDNLREYLKPTGDPRADDLAEEILYKYGPGSAHFTTLSQLMMSPTVKASAAEKGVPATLEGVRPVIVKGCLNATSAFIPQAAASPESTSPVSPLPRSSAGTDGVPTLPGEGDPLPVDLEGTTCREVLGYWAPLIAQEPANAELIASRVYGGRGSYVVNEALIALGKNTSVESDSEEAVDEVCATANW